MPDGDASSLRAAALPSQECGHPLEPERTVVYSVREEKTLALKIDQGIGASALSLPTPAIGSMNLVTPFNAVYRSDQPTSPVNQPNASPKDSDQTPRLKVLESGGEGEESLIGFIFSLLNRRTG
jgi:hypothetical protein